MHYIVSTYPFTVFLGFPAQVQAALNDSFHDHRQSLSYSVHLLAIIQESLGYAEVLNKPPSSQLL